jgi:alcohol dehydrogenase class IV
MTRREKRAEYLIKSWKKGTYLFGLDVLKNTDCLFYGERKDAVIVVNPSAWLKPYLKQMLACFQHNGVRLQNIIHGAQSNTPQEDVYRIAELIAHKKPAWVFVVGGGSTLDAAKAANVLVSLGTSNIEPFFGVDQVTAQLKKTGKKLTPLFAIQTTASSASHLTKYANVSEMLSGKKKLIVDEAIIPYRAVFDYRTTINMPPVLTLDGAMDGFSHCWEVFMGATGKSYWREIKEITIMAFQLIFEALPRVLKNPADAEARYRLGLATDLGGYAIMLKKQNPRTGLWESGGTGGGHLGSFQLVKFLSHGRAVAILNLYYAVLFARYTEEQNHTIASMLQQIDCINKSVRLAKLKERKLALEMVQGLFKFYKRIGFPRSLMLAGVPREQIKVMLEESKNPQLAMKLANMPLPLDIKRGDIENLMAPTLKAAYKGEVALVPDAKI